MNPKQRGTELRLKKLMLYNVGTAQPALVSLLLNCTRCSTKVAAELSGEYVDESQVYQRCLKCSVILSATLRPCLVHETALTVGYVDTKNCSVSDILSITPRAACIDCPNSFVLPAMKRNARTECGCHECEHKLAIQATVFEVHEHTQPGAAGGDGSGSDRLASRGTAKLKTRIKDRQTIVEGTALPENGACVHFKKSLRWLRFGCCGRACVSSPDACNPLLAPCD